MTIWNIFFTSIASSCGGLILWGLGGIRFSLDIVLYMLDLRLGVGVMALWRYGVMALWR